MNKEDLTQRLARRTRVSKAEAADELDRVVNRILRNLRKGEPAPMPGLGTFLPGPSPDFRFEQKTDKERQHS